MQSFRLMDLDHRLAADRDGRKLRELRDRLESSRRKLRSLLDGGIGGEDHRRVQAAITAYQAGIELLPSLWEAQRG